MSMDSVKHLLDGPVEPGSVPVEYMDYDYISKSSNVKELEKILKALRYYQFGETYLRRENFLN